MKKLIKSILTRNYQAEYQDKLAFSYFKSCQKVLDIGCGKGRFIKLDPQKISGIDSNKDTVKHCQRLKLKVKLGSATKIPYQNNSLDGLHCSHVIEHLTPKEVYAFLKEASRVLKSGGILVIRTPVMWSGFYDNLTHSKPYSPRAITRYLVENAPDTTFPRLKTKFKVLNLLYRHKPLIPILYPYLKKSTKTGYLLALEKLS